MHLYDHHQSNWLLIKSSLFNFRWFPDRSESSVLVSVLWSSSASSSGRVFSSGSGSGDYQGEILWHTLDVHHHHSEPGTEERRRNRRCVETTLQHWTFLHSQTHLRHALLLRGHHHRPQPHLWCHHWYLRWSQNRENKQRRDHQEHLLHLWPGEKGSIDNHN